jgi:hypothetical protein
MDLRIESNPEKHIIVDNFFTRQEYEEVFNEAQSLVPHCEPGLMLDSETGKDIAFPQKITSIWNYLPIIAL